jgi:phosphatidate cytidylyltransferase
VKSALSPEHEAANRFRSFKTRTITTLMMISGFLLIIAMGHFYCALLVMVATISMYKEIVSLRRRKEKDEKIIFSWLDWYFFFVFAFFVLPKLFLRRILVEDTFSQGTIIYSILYDYHNLICFNLFSLGIVLFVWSLERGSYRY